MESIAGILLGAGSSERFGSQKLLARLQTGERLMERALRIHLASQISPLILVISPNLRNTIMDEPDIFSCSEIEIGDKVNQWYVFSCRWGKGRLITNENYREGLSSSIRAGLGCLIDQEKASGILISLADLPFLALETVNFFINAYAKEKAGILLPVFKGTTGHPVVIDINRFQDEINQIAGDIGLRTLLKRYPREVKKIPWQDDSVTRDIDTPSDLRTLTAP